MANWITSVVLSLHLLLPVAYGSQTSLKDPLDYSLKQYGMILCIAMLGGLAGWFAKVKRGEIPQWSIYHLVGELVTSALAGLLCFWLCEWAGLHPLLTAPLTGMAGHMGNRAINLIEEWGIKRARKAMP